MRWVATVVLGALVVTMARGEGDGGGEEQAGLAREGVVHTRVDEHVDDGETLFGFGQFPSEQWALSREQRAVGCASGQYETGRYCCASVHMSCVCVCVCVCV